MSDLKGHDLLALAEWTPEQVERVLALAGGMKSRPEEWFGSLAGRSVVLVFEKPSLRTRVSFEIGLARLGAHSLFYDTRSERLGERESVHDYAKNLERYSDAIVARVFAHATVEELAEHSGKPVVNALSDLHHPCQALADVLTLREAAERRGWSGRLRAGFVGDGNNVCHSFMIACAMVGIDFVWIGPAGYEPDAGATETARRFAAESGAAHEHAHDVAALDGAHAVYSDTWVSMGSEGETQRRMEAFQTYRVTPGVMEAAGDGAVFMHCLPAHRGEEVDAAVIDDTERSVVFDQAENRMWAQMALMHELLGGGAS